MESCAGRIIHRIWPIKYVTRCQVQILLARVTRDIILILWDVTNSIVSFFWLMRRTGRKRNPVQGRAPGLEGPAPGKGVLFPAGKSTKEGRPGSGPQGATKITCFCMYFFGRKKVPKKGAQERGSAQTVWLKLIVLTGKERGAPARCQGATKITFKREIL